jgi:light-independent protochlorophyllide reductase subunit B
MKLTVWTYEGPPHVGAMRIATAMKDVHYVLHAPQGDTYADLLFTMIERLKERPPVTYTTFQARDLGGDTAELFKSAAKRAFERFKPNALLVGSSCTAELIQDDPGGLAEAIGLPIPVIPLELPAYQKKENWGASETFYQLIRTFGSMAEENPKKIDKPVCNILGPTALGFRHRDDLEEITKLLKFLGVEINVVAPLGASVMDLKRLNEAKFNVVLYPEIAHSSALWLLKKFGQPFTKKLPYGAVGTNEFVKEVLELAQISSPEKTPEVVSQIFNRSAWYSSSVDSNYLTNKRVFIFGDGSHVLAAKKVAIKEFGFSVVGIGTYSREMAREVRSSAEESGLQALITDDYLDVEKAIEETQPELILGTQMERHIAKRLGIGCAVISAPMHVQDFPSRYSPQMGYEGANVLFDSWIHPLMMGLEEHLLTMFREDFEFKDDATPSHLSHGQVNQEVEKKDSPKTLQESVLQTDGNEIVWEKEAEAELKKIPFFVRGKARRNTESFATSQGFSSISLETLYDAKAYHAR